MQPVQIVAGDGANKLLDFLKKELNEASKDGEVFKVNQEQDDGLIAVECTKRKK